MRKVTFLLSLCLVMVPLVASAQNTSFGTAASLAISGKGKNQFYNNAGNANTFYRWFAVAGRSYCVETEGAEFERTSIDTVMSVFRQDTTTLIGTNDDADCGTECPSFLASRVCYIAAATEINFAQVVPFAGSATSVFYQIRVVESSLYSPWFFSGSGFEAFILIKNNSQTARNTVVTLYNTAGGVVGTSALLAIPANGSRNFQVSAAAPAGFGLASATGTVRISSDSPLGGLSANVTSLSFGGGISFDTPATPRQDWAAR
jgi:hypothetical protein